MAGDKRETIEQTLVKDSLGVPPPGRDLTVSRRIVLAITLVSYSPTR